VAEPAVEQLESENKALRRRLEELEDTIKAIRRGTVDAFVIETPEGSQVYTLAGADRPYRLFIETMAQGALTLDESGTILFCNRRFADLMQADASDLVGESIRRYVLPASHPVVETILREGQSERVEKEVTMRTLTGANLFTRMLPVSSPPGAGEFGPSGPTPEFLYRNHQTLLSHLDALGRAGVNMARIRLDGWWQALELETREVLPLPGFAKGEHGLA